MSNLFDNISEKNKLKILRFLEASTLYFPKNVSIMSSVKWDNAIGFIEKGYVQIIRLDYNGNKTIIEELEENSLFGSTLSSLNNYEYDIITKEETKLIIIEYDNILKETNNHYSFYNTFIRNLLEILNAKITERNERIQILTKKSIRDKLLEYFGIISKRNGSKHIYLTLSYSELADYLAVNRSAMMRELKNLRDEGFIKTTSKRITLLY